MKRVLISLCFVIVCIVNLPAQMSIEEINRRLDTRPYFNLGLDHRANVVLPDSVKAKMISALRRELPRHFADSVFTLPNDVVENIENFAWNQCQNDTICFEKIFAERYSVNLQHRKDYYYNQCYAISLILASGSWGVKEAIPYLKKELQNPRCRNNSVEIEMALAKLCDSAKQVLLERYTLSFLLQATPLDTVNDNIRINYDDFRDVFWTVPEAIQTAMYLQSKEMLLNILDLIYIRGLSESCIGLDCSYFPDVSFFVDEFCSREHFRDIPNFNEIRKVCDDYRSAIRYLSNRRLNRREQRELDRLLSTEYRTMIKNQIKDWVIENVNFK